MAKKKNEKNEISKLKTKLFSRGASLLSVGVSASASAAKFAISTAFKDKDEKKEAYMEFLQNQFEKFVSEVGQLKGGVMKAGQMLSIYGEHFFPKEVNKILKRLQSDTIPVSFKEIEKVLVRGLGKEKFQKIKFIGDPIGTASLGQVYLVEIDGVQRALKVQYPGVADSLDSDLKAVKRLLSLFKLGFEPEKFGEIYEEIRMMLHREADYKKELAALKKHRELVADDDSIVVPEPIEEYSSKRILCMSYEKGIRLDDPKLMQLSQERRNALGKLILKVLFLEIFHWKSVQTDSHIGNYLVQIKEDGFDKDRIVLLDFGALRKLPKSYVNPFRKMALSAVKNDKEGILKGAMDLTFLKPDDPEAMQDLFAKIVVKGVEPFSKEYASEPEQVDGYNWDSSEIVDELVALAKHAVFSFRLRPPPKEAVFVDRKLVGTFTLLKTLKVRYGPHDLALKYLESE